MTDSGKYEKVFAKGRLRPDAGLSKEEYKEKHEYLERVRQELLVTENIDIAVDNVERARKGKKN